MPSSTFAGVVRKSCHRGQTLLSWHYTHGFRICREVWRPAGYEISRRLLLRGLGNVIRASSVDPDLRRDDDCVGAG